MKTNRPNSRCLDHIDLRVPSLAAVRPFYQVLLPALGFTKDVSDETWLQFEAENGSGRGEFFGITESTNHASPIRLALPFGPRAQLQSID